jgi:hypothetical protein
MARETSTRTYPQIVFLMHHPLSHHTNNPDKLTRLAKVTYHVSLFAYHIDKLKLCRRRWHAVDHSIFLLGSGMAIPMCTITSTANRRRGRCAREKGALHLKYEQPVALANLHLTLLDKTGAAGCIRRQQRKDRGDVVLMSGAPVAQNLEKNQ